MTQYTFYPHFGSNIWVGNFEACDYLPVTQRRIHLWHPYQEGSGICQHVRRNISDVLTPREFEAQRVGNDLLVCYEDNQPLNLIQDTIWDFAHGTDDPILVHCAAGLSRSPTLALLCMCARGEKPTEALHKIYDCMWHCNMVPILYHGRIRQIFELAEQKGK